MLLVSINLNPFFVKKKNSLMSKEAFIFKSSETLVSVQAPSER